VKKKKKKKKKIVLHTRPFAGQSSLLSFLFSIVSFFCLLFL
jgi:hypothetical protein